MTDDNQYNHDDLLRAAAIKAEEVTDWSRKLEAWKALQDISQHDHDELLLAGSFKAGEKVDWARKLEAWKALYKLGTYALASSIGEVYERGAPTVPRNFDDAVRWYKNGVEDFNEARSHIGLGRCYCLGNGVERNYGRALRHFGLAHEQGHPLATIWLARMYFNGRGVEKDFDRVKMYLAQPNVSEYFWRYMMLTKIALDEGKMLEGIGLYFKGLRLRAKIRKQDRWDHRLQ